MAKLLWNWSFKKSMLLALAIGLTVSVTILILGKGATVSASQQGTVVGFELPAEAYTGELITVKLVVNNAQNVAGFQATVTYDQNSLTTSAYIEGGLEASGRDILLLDPVPREGAIVLGAATCPAADCGNAYASQGPQQVRGGHGYLELAALELNTDIPGSYELKLENVKLVDPQGNPLAASVNNAVLVIHTR
jgi:hypothetical protein